MADKQTEGRCGIRPGPKEEIAPKDGSFTEAKAVLVAALTSDDGAARLERGLGIAPWGPAATAAVPALIELLKGATDNSTPWGDRKRAARSYGSDCPW